MAYSDYGSFVHVNGVRRYDKEDVGVFDTDEKDLPSAARVFANILKNKEQGNNEWWRHSQHGVMGDGNTRVACYKQGFPKIYYWKKGDDQPTEVTQEQVIKLLHLENESYVDHYTHEGKEICDFDYDYPEISFEYEGHKFKFISSQYSDTNHYYAEMTCPNGEYWTCDYDYGFGAGF